jgi:hypothetical protein
MGSLRSYLNKTCRPSALAVSDAALFASSDDNAV